MEKLRLYEVNKNYITYLQETDKTVQNNSRDSLYIRPYLGVVFYINNNKFFAPLSSDKRKRHKNAKDSNPSIVKLIHGRKYLGIIKLNNMIPINDSELTRFDMDKISKINPKYYKLLSLQMKAITKNTAVILEKANLIYDLVTNKRHPFFIDICVNFAALEKACKSYTPKRII